MNLLQRVLGRPEAPVEAERNDFFAFQGNAYPTYAVGQSLDPRSEEVGRDFEGMVRGAYHSNGVVFACMLARMSLFSEARFQYRRMTNGRPGDLFGDRNLRILERPWPTGTTGDLLSRVITDSDTAGNAFIVRREDRLRRLRPDWTTVVIGSNEDADTTAIDVDAEVIGYMYHPGGRGSGNTPVPFLPEEVAHFAPHPDPLASFRGMSWLTPVLREIEADHATTNHKAAFFRNGATPQVIVSFDKDVSAADVERFKALMDAGHTGPANAYKTLYLGGGADPTVVGKDLAQLDFKATQGAGETRIAAAAGMHPSVIGLSEGLQGASLNAGNFSAARRLTGDKTLRPLWRNVAGSLASLVDVPPGAELWYDDRDIPFLREDSKDQAEISLVKAQTIESLVRAGYEPASIIKAVEADDMGLLSHTGFASVQLQEIGTTSADQSTAVPPVTEEAP